MGMVLEAQEAPAWRKLLMSSAAKAVALSLMETLSVHDVGRLALREE